MSALIFPATPQTNGTIEVVLPLRAVVHGSAQWIQTAGAGTATIAVYGTSLPRDHESLTDTDPLTNPFWSRIKDAAGVPINFTDEPTGANTSGLLGFWAMGLSNLLVVFTLAGTLTLQVWSHINESP